MVTGMKQQVWAGLAAALVATIFASIYFSDDLKSMIMPRKPTGTTSAGAAQAATGSDSQSAAPRQASSGEATDGLQTATFGSGCFWCTEAVFTQLKGVESVKSGYSGGEAEN